MQIELRIHSSYKPYFGQRSYSLEVIDFEDIHLYLRNLHPKFDAYLKAVQRKDTEEAVCLVDSTFRTLDYNTKQMKKIKDGDVYYVAPMIVGGGGKRGFIAIAAFAVLAYATGGFGLMAANPSTAVVMGGADAVGAVGAEAAVVSGSQASASIFGSLGTAVSNMPTFLKSIIGNLAISFITSLFTKKPKSPVAATPDSAARTENNMFNSLQNSTESGTPIALNYGMTRVSGQFVSGYLHTTAHGKGNDPAVQSLFQANHTPNAILDEAA